MKRWVDGWIFGQISRWQTAFHLVSLVTRHQCPAAGQPQVRWEALTFADVTVTSCGAWRGFSGRMPTPLWGAGCSSKRRKQTLVLVNVGTGGRNIAGWLYAGDKHTSSGSLLGKWVLDNPEPRSLAPETQNLSHLGCSKHKSAQRAPSMKFRTKSFRYPIF